MIPLLPQKIKRAKKIILNYEICESRVKYLLALSQKYFSVVCQMDDDELRNYYKYFEPFEKKLHFYFMLRVVMAPVIEAIILLDRLLFLREKVNYA